MRKTKLEIFHIVTIVAWVSRLFQALVQVLIISLVTSILNIEEYAAFVLITSLTAWYMLADFGIGLSLQNTISELRTKNEDPSKYIGSAIVALIFLYVFFSLLLYLFSTMLSESLLLRYENIKNQSIIFFISSILMLTSAMSSIIYKIWYAVEKGYLSNILPAIASIISLALIYAIGLLYKSDENLLLYIMVAFLLPTCFFPFFFMIKLILVNNFYWEKDLSIFLVKRGSGFFLFGLVAAITLQLDYLIISRILDSNSDIIIYHTLSKVFSISFFIYSAFLLAIWPNITEKISSGQSYLIKSYIKKYIPLGIYFMIFFTFLIIIFIDKIMPFLVKNTEVKVPVTLIILFGIYYIIRVITDTFAMILQSGNNLKPLWTAVPIQAALSVTLQLYLAEKLGLNGILIALILSFLLTVSWYLPFKVLRILN